MGGEPSGHPGYQQGIVVKSVIAVLLIVIGGMPNIAGTSATEKTKWLASEVVTSYVSGTSPTLILGLDNNLEICLALREARTISELRSDGIPVTDSQRSSQVYRAVRSVENLLCKVAEGGSPKALR